MNFHAKALWLSVSHRWRKAYKANVCGHETKQEGVVITHGKKSVLTLQLEQNGQPQYCLDCIGKMSILCTWCGQPIHAGDPVTLCTKPTDEPEWERPKYAVEYAEEPGVYVGCVRWGCQEDGATMAGFWVPPGKVSLGKASLLICSAEDAYANEA